MRAMVLLVLALLVFPAFAAASDRAQPDVDITGTYMCQGQSPDGTTYHGIVQIVQIDDTFRVRWALASNSGGEVDLVGVGIFSNGVFAVSYFGGAPGVGVYKIDGARLVGEWTIGGADGAVYTEMLTRVEVQPGAHPPGAQQPGVPSPGSDEEHDAAPAHANPASYIKVAFKNH